MTDNIAPISCPLCSSGNINAFSDGGDVDEVWFKVSCDDCGARWIEVYTFDYICELQDANGNEIRR